jgi:hypothetical protein
MQHIPAPSAPGRVGRTEEQRRNFEEQIKAREAAIIKQRELWSVLNLFVSRNGGWLVSAPSERPLRLEVPIYSELPDKLFDLGYALQPPDGVSGERMIGDRITQILCFKFDVSPPR